MAIVPGGVFGEGCFPSKIKYHDFQKCHFWVVDGIFEIKMIKKICLGVFRFWIGALLVFDSHASESRVSPKLTLAIIDIFGL